PRHWEDKTIVAFSAPSRPGQSTAASFVMTRDQLTDSDTLASYADRQLAELSKRVDGFELIEKRDTQVAGARAVALRFTSKALAVPEQGARGAARAAARRRGGPAPRRRVLHRDRAQGRRRPARAAVRSDDRRRPVRGPSRGRGGDMSAPPLFHAAKKGDRVSH